MINSLVYPVMRPDNRPGCVIVVDLVVHEVLHERFHVFIQSRVIVFVERSKCCNI